MKTFEDKLDIKPAINSGDKKAEIETIELDEIDTVKSISPEKDLESDYNLIRNKLNYAFERGIEILDNATRLIKSDPCPRAIEAASTIFKTLNDNSKELLNLHKNRNKISKELADDPKKDLNVVRGNVSGILKDEEK